MNITFWLLSWKSLFKYFQTKTNQTNDNKKQNQNKKSKTSNNNPSLKFETFSQSLQTRDAESMFKLLQGPERCLSNCGVNHLYYQEK